MASDFEWSGRYQQEQRDFAITFFVPRRPTLFELTFQTDGPLQIEKLSYHHRGTIQDIAFGVRSQPRGDALRIRVTPFAIVPADKVAIRLKAPVPNFNGQVRIEVAERKPQDVAIVREAHRLAASGDLTGAIGALRDYEEFTIENPSVSLWLSDWYRMTGHVDRSEDYVIRALVTGSFDFCAEKYREVQRGKPPRSVEGIRQLQADAGAWDVGRHYGLIVLERRQDFVLGLGDWHIRKAHELIEVRRSAAARMMGQLRFPFAATKEVVLHTALRIIHSNDEPEEVPPEHFTIGDHENRNILITVEDEKTGHWILPDLSPGDVIEWTYHLMCRNRRINDSPQVFIRAPVFDEHSPTFRASSAFMAPRGEPLHYLLLNGDAERQCTQDIDWDITTFEAERYVPAKGTGFAFENQYLNPAVVCVSSGVDWSDVARDAYVQNFGANDEGDRLPEPLDSFVGEAGDPGSAIEFAFYWIRDKLKYASMRSGTERIGHEGRAQRIVESGVGNCNDKSYLLSMVCRKFGVPSEFVAISTKDGLLIEEAPADQFDHVFVRAQINGEWRYMDAANPWAPFGSPPAWCQGMRAMVLDGRGTFLTIPVDPPSQNKLEIIEVFDTIVDGRLQGCFTLRAFGHAGRLTDDRWKMLSLSIDDQRQAGQEALRQFLPSALMLDHRRESNTSVAGELWVSGHHTRGPLVMLASWSIGGLSWQIPFLPIGHWRTLQIDRLFVIDFPTEVSIEARFVGDLRGRVKDISHLEPMETAAIRVAESTGATVDAVTVRRTITLERKLYRDRDLELVPEGLERIEKALQLVVSIA